MSNIKRRSQVVCPHCGANCFFARSEEVTLLLKKSTCICKNPDCLHSFIVHQSVVSTLSPSRMPNPAVKLPVSDSGLIKKR